jgi:hypothetical protein
MTTAAGRLELERRCRVLTSEMLAWLGDPEGDKKVVYGGTVGALIKCYQTDRSSPYYALGRVQHGFMATGAGRSIARSVSVELIA